ncbi:molybdate ABC transporter substrate-binding protein [Congregicoccus parvus]|uniref:molybdate ABC transporter substrate-binding protein n=1 Tax=Congregicoccus parvus TaxID=3081749 RepID=UPI003FA571CC
MARHTVRGALVAVGLALASVLASAAGAAEIRVLAAASLSDVLREIAPLHARATGDTIVFGFGGSGMLARQILEGAPADVFVSADTIRFDRLEAAGLVADGTRRILATNTLVLVVAAERGAEVAEASDLGGPAIRRLAIGEPATVPAGTYAKAHLEKTGLWSNVQRKLVPLDNVRAVLAAVEAGNADAGFVYRTDALASARVRIAIEVPHEDALPVAYPAGVLTDAESPEAARALLDFLVGAEAQAVFAKHGFLPPN